MATRDLSKSLQRTLTHLKPPPRKGGKFSSPIPTHFRSQPPFVQIKDRIPFWNIAPEDKVVVIKGKEGVKGSIGTVNKVERENNRVFLKENQFGFKKRQSSQYPGENLEPTSSIGGRDGEGNSYNVPQPIHISNLRLLVKDQGKEYQVTRIRKSKITWDRFNKKFHWNRYGLIPQLVGTVLENNLLHTGWVKIPWPKDFKFDKTTPSELDTIESQSLKTTFEPITETSSSSSGTLEDELKISQQEFGKGYHSRAARTKRFNEKKELEKQFGKETADAIVQVQRQIRREEMEKQQIKGTVGEKLV